MGFESLIPRLVLLPLSILSLSVHEFAHAWSAWRLGDDTAAREGRLTLNPVSHIDFFGTILIPLFAPFGWAKPVPVNPARFRRSVSMAGGMALTASAGPISNLLLALLSAVVLGLGVRFAPETFDYGSLGRGLLLGRVLDGTFIPGLIPLNVGLGIFNLLPVPPLDGSRIVAWVMPTRLREQWHAVERFTPFLLLAVFMYGGRIMSGPILAVTEWVLSVARYLA